MGDYAAHTLFAYHVLPVTRVLSVRVVSVTGGGGGRGWLSRRSDNADRFFGFLLSSGYSISDFGSAVGPWSDGYGLGQILLDARFCDTKKI